MRYTLFFIFIFLFIFLGDASDFYKKVQIKRIDFYYKQANKYKELKKYNDAENYYKKVISFKFYYEIIEKAYKELFDIYLMQSRYRDAMDLKKEYLKRFPDGKYFSGTPPDSKKIALERPVKNTQVSADNEKSKKSKWIRIRDKIKRFFRKTQNVSEAIIGAQVAFSINITRRFVKDKEVIDRVRKIGERVAAQSPRQDIKYKFYVINDSSLNAFAVPGGYIYVTLGTVKATLHDDSALACVLAHEIGHITSRHSIHAIERSILFYKILDMAKSNKIEKHKKALQIAYIFLYQLPLSRKNEYEADKWGVELSYKAGYDPKGLIRFFRLLQKKYGRQSSGGGVLISTHPATENRINRALELINNLKSK